MRLLPPLLGITRLDHQRSTDIRKNKLNVSNLIFGDSHIQHTYRIPKQVQNANHSGNEIHSAQGGDGENTERVEA
jgi:hypothetical protein